MCFVNLPGKENNEKSIEYLQSNKKIDSVVRLSNLKPTDIICFVNKSRKKTTHKNVCCILKCTISIFF